MVNGVLAEGVVGALDPPLPQADAAIAHGIKMTAAR
jgi:hypothetical protein